jgi:hypothetical protein
MRRLLLTPLIALAAGSAFAAPLAMKEERGLRWVCGGAGVEERQEIAALEREANLRLLFVTQKRGGYLADVEVALSGRGASAPSLKFTSEGPICLLKAPAGSYTVQAEYAGKQRSAQVTVAADPGKPVKAVLAFPGEPWDGIWASAEEKSGARNR